MQKGVACERTDNTKFGCWYALHKAMRHTNSGVMVAQIFLMQTQ